MTQVLTNGTTKCGQEQFNIICNKYFIYLYFIILMFNYNKKISTSNENLIQYMVEQIYI